MEPQKPGILYTPEEAVKAYGRYYEKERLRLEGELAAARKRLRQLRIRLAVSIGLFAVYLAGVAAAIALALRGKRKTALACLVTGVLAYAIYLVKEVVTRKERKAP